MSFRLWICAGVVAVAGGCVAGPVSQASNVEPAAARSADATLRLASRWLDALRNADTKALAGLSRFPFQFRDTGTEGDCSGGSAQGADELAPLLRCLFDDELVMGDLKDNPAPLTEILKPANLPAWAKGWRDELSPGSAAVLFDVPGNGNAFYYVVVVGEREVSALWKHATFEAN